MPSVCTRIRVRQRNEPNREDSLSRFTAHRGFVLTRWAFRRGSGTVVAGGAQSSGSARPNLSSSRRAGALRSAATACFFLSFGLNTEAAKVDFNRDIRPIMTDTCFRCHGFDAKARKARLRLDLREEALKPAKSGAVPIVPGQPAKSEVVRRVFTTDEDDRMPPAEIHKVLTTDQKELFRRWIAEGAEYRDHWAFLPPAAVVPTGLKQSRWPKTPVDCFILARLEQKKLKPSREADKATIIRRVSLDLTGIPPTPVEVDSFLADHSPGAFENLVDHLLASPRYGERMAQDWLDAARFADSNGYQVDRDRETWAWREWVIKAFNRNLPFDQFTIEQLAGDLLPNPTLDQKIATGFHRNHMINEEGGIIPEEFLAEYCADRVETTATVWLGLTLGCARCHDHKYDPLTQKDFYSFFAFFHNVPESGVGTYSAPIRRNTPPFVKLPTPEIEAKLAALKQELEETNQHLTNLIATVLASSGIEWEERARAATPPWSEAETLSASGGTNSLDIKQPGGWVQVPSLKPGARTVSMTARIPKARVTALQVELSPSPDNGTNFAAKLSVAKLRLFRAESPEAEKHAVLLRPTTLTHSAPAEKLAKALDEKNETSWTVTLSADRVESGVFELPEGPQGSNSVTLKLELELAPDQTVPAWQLRLRASDIAPGLLVPPDILATLHKPAAERTDAEKKRVDDFRLVHEPEHFSLTHRLADLKKEIEEADLSIPITLVMEELAEPRPTFVLVRGAYDKKGDPVTAATPSPLPAFLSGQPTNRLGLARWLVDPRNPLTARVTVNRLWQSIFGVGLVRTAEDFGSRGELPSHPELLDWLALEFVRTGWDVKRMMKLLVTSATYRQDSRITSELQALDPENRLLARGPRYRLPAETIRDQALAVSGILVEKLGGPSVKPYHPPGLYEQVVSGTGPSTYVQGKGDELYRRSLYTYWKRSVPNPAMLVFDMPFRETCTVRRARTTTPLQALNLLNDPTYIEAARFLAQRMMRDGGTTPKSRIRHGFHLATGREPRPNELSVLVTGWRRMEASFRSNRSDAESLLIVGEMKADPALDPVELAAYSTVASTLLNLDETITKE